MDMTMKLDGVVIPKPSNFLRIEEYSETTNQTIGGQVYTDFIHCRGRWELSWSLMKYEDYQIIYNAYVKQFEEETNITFEYNGEIVMCRIAISEEGIKYNASIIEGFSITIYEKEAI